MVFRSLGAALALALFALLGFSYSTPSLAALDLAGGRMLGVATPLAIVFTRSGYAGALIGIGIAGIILALALRVNVAFPAMLFVTQIVSQLSANGAKLLFHRHRPDHWLFREELGLSYPSGHAVTAIVFYVGWALIVWSWPLPKSVRIAVVCAMTFWALGIGWSRVALGAHHITDVLGGYLLGTAWLLIFLLFASMLERAVAIR